MLPAQKRGDPVREPRKVSPSPTGFRGTVPACGKRRGLVSTEGHSPETFGGGFEGRNTQTLREQPQGRQLGASELGLSGC